MISSIGRWSNILRLRLRSLFRQQQVDTDLARELRAHIEDQVAEYVDLGMSPAAARDRARREFGPAGSIEEGCRETRRVALVHNVVRDVRYAVRTLGRQPVLVAAAATSIALGVAANLTIFGLAGQLLLSTPTAARPDRLVHIRTGNGSHVSYDGWRLLHESGVLAGIAGYSVEATLNWRHGENSVTLMPLVVTANFFEIVGVPLALGRGFGSAEAAVEKNPRVVVLSHRLWQQQLGADRSVLGREIVLNGEPHVVTGVLAPGVRSLPGFGLSPDLYVPLSPALVPDLHEPRAATVQLVGRLRDGQSVEAGRAAVSTVAARLPQDLEFRTITSFAPVGGLSQAKDFKEVAAFFLVLLVVTVLVLAIACANVAGLLIARSTVRRREIALRAALGASRARLVQQLLTEAFVLALAGTVAGLGMTAVLGGLLSQVSLPLPIPIRLGLPIDMRLMWVAFALAIATTLLCGAAPAAHATRSRLLPALNQDEPRYGHRRVTLRALLVVGQVAVTTVLLAAAVIFVRNLARAGSVDPGFDAARAVVAHVTFVEGRQGRAAAPAVERMVERVAAVPGVEVAGYAEGMPLTVFSGAHVGTLMRLSTSATPVHVEYAANDVGPGYFAAMGIRILRGRDFSRADRAGAPLVAVVNKGFVDRFLDGHDPIGVRLHEVDREGAAPVEIVGVVADGKYRTLGEDREAAVYTSYLQQRSVERMVHLIARTSAPEVTSGLIREAVLQFDGSTAVTVQPVASALAFAFLPSRIGAVLFGAMGLLGTVLAITGLYGVVSYGVARRTAEIGLRLALGASRGAVLAMVMKECAVVAGVGIAGGLLLGMLTTGPLAAFLVAGLRPADPLSFAWTASAIAAASAFAAWSPARRAMRIDPVRALRHD
jgi:predicted permease